LLGSRRLKRLHEESAGEDSVRGIGWRAPGLETELYGLMERLQGIIPYTWRLDIGDYRG
jgi:hypothetical protein